MKAIFLITLFSTSWMQTAQAFIGFHIKMYNPSCAYGCRGVISSAPLSCTPSHDHGHGGGHHAPDPTTPECRANDTSFLTTLAYCMKTKCAKYNVHTSLLEKYWEEQTTGDPGVQPKWTYGEAVAQVETTPKREYESGETLNYTAIVNNDSYEVGKKSMEHFEVQETMHYRYGLIIFLVGAGIPILMKAISYVPYSGGIFDKLNPYLVYPSTIGKYHVQSLPYSFGNPPTMGQGAYIAAFVILNIILASVGYVSNQPSTFYNSRYQEILGGIANRTGTLAFATAPLTLLFAGRNNLLIWITNWPHSTFILLHRWVARIFAIHTILHSICWLHLAILRGDYADQLPTEYWIWGCVGTVAVCAMLVFSVLWFRQKSYEFFLVLHILLAVFVLAGSWYHVEYLFQRKWGTEIWMYISFVIWFLDRLIRVIRVLKVGPRRAKITDVGSGFVRVDVHGVRWNQAGVHAYAYFPSLVAWRPWENHPFSVVPTAFINPRSQSVSDRDVEKSSHVVATSTASTSTTPGAGVSLYIRKSSGMTSYLQRHDSLLVLLDGPYRNHNHAELLNCDRLILIGGGIGVTAILPFLRSHINAKLYWSMKESATGLLDDLKGAIEDNEKEIRTGQRFDSKEILANEIEQGWKRIGVMVCGPGGLCDDVRANVVELGKQRKAVFVLHVEAFSW